MKIKYFYFVFLIAIALFICLTLSLNIWENFDKEYFIYPDANSYVTSASWLYKNHFTPHFIRPIGWPVIIGLPYLVNANATKFDILYFSVVLNFICWLISIYYVFKIISKYINHNIAFAFTLVFVFLVSNILLVFQSMTEGFFVLLLILFAYHLLEYISTKANKHLLLSCLFIFYSAITRPANFYPAIITLIMALVLCRKSLRYAGSIMLLFIATVGLQCYLMNRTYGKPTVSFIKNHTAYYYLFARAEFFATPEKWNNNYETFYKEREVFANNAAIEDSVNNNAKSVWPYLDKTYKENISYNMKANLPVVIKQLTQNIIENSTTGSNFPYMLRNESSNPVFETSRKLVVRITKYENILFTLLFFVNWLVLALFVLRKKYFNNGLFHGILILQFICSYFLITSGISYWQGDRFNYVFSPLTLTIFTYLYNQYKQRKTGNLNT